MAITIMVVQGQSFTGDLVATVLRGRGFDCTVCHSGPDALSRLSKQSVDLVVAEIELPGMSGLDFVTQVRRSAEARSVPIILLADSLEKTQVVRAAALGIHGFLLKGQLSVERFLSRILELVGTTEASPPPKSSPVTPPRTGHESRLSVPTPVPPKPAREAKNDPASTLPQVSSAIPRLLTREQSIQRLDNVASGKTIAGVVAQVMAMVNSPETDLCDLVKLLESDPILAARVLQFANSASAGARNRIRTVDDAVRTIGVREIGTLALNIGIFAAFPPDEADGFNSLRCWQHSFAVADLIPLMARERDPQVACTNHLSALCHDLGEILLRQHFSQEYARIVECALARSLPVHEVESVALGIRHPELVSRLLSRMGLPQPVVHAIREFHERQVRGQEGGMSQGTRALVIANQVAHGMLLAASPLSTVGPITRTEWRMLGTDKNSPNVDPLAKRNQILCTTNVLARLPSKDERELVVPLIKKRARRLWYLRPQSYIELDPLGFALSLTCDVTISPNLPAPDEWSSLDGLIAVGINPGVTPLIPAELTKARIAGNRPEMPMLLLASQETKPSELDHILTRQYPISLRDLDTWLGTLNSSPESIEMAAAY